MENDGKTGTMKLMNGGVFDPGVEAVELKAATPSVPRMENDAKIGKTMKLRKKGEIFETPPREEAG